MLTLPGMDTEQQPVAVAYLRASTTEQHLSPDAQRAEIDAWAAREGVYVAAYALDAGVSGSTPVDAREGFLEALSALDEHGASMLAVARRDRLARSVVVAAVAGQLVADHGARIVAADGSGNGDGPEAELMRVILDGFAAYERARIISRTRAALAVKRARGECIGGVPYGSRLADDGVHLEPHPDEQRALQRLRELRADGLSLRAVAARLDAEGHAPRGKRWHAKTVARLAA